MPDSSEDAVEKTKFGSVPIELLITVGSTRQKISDLLDIQNGSVIELNSGIDDPVWIYANGKKIASGALEERVDGSETRLSVRVMSLVWEN